MQTNKNGVLSIHIQPEATLLHALYCGITRSSRVAFIGSMKDGVFLAFAFAIAQQDVGTVISLPK
jgi:hypothetical protein